jgi:hypothetical protein
MKIVGYVLLGIGCSLFVVDAFGSDSSPSHVVNYFGTNAANDILIAGICICIVSLVLVSIAEIREQSAKRAAERALQETLPVWADAKTWEPVNPKDP